MKTRIKKTSSILLSGLFSIWAVAATAGYDLTRNTISSGGGTSSGGQFSISCTVGQPVCGLVKAGTVAMDQGFWADAVAVQTVGSPRLTLVRSGSNVILSWPSSATGFSLQFTTNLNPAAWTSVAQTAVLSGTQYQVPVPAALQKQFFRLIKQ